MGNRELSLKWLAISIFLTINPAYGYSVYYARKPSVARNNEDTSSVWKPTATVFICLFSILLLAAAGFYFGRKYCTIKKGKQGRTIPSAIELSPGKDYVLHETTLNPPKQPFTIKLIASGLSAAPTEIKSDEQQRKHTQNVSRQKSKEQSVSEPKISKSRNVKRENYKRPTAHIDEPGYLSDGAKTSTFDR